MNFAPILSAILLVFVLQLCPNYFSDFSSLLMSTLPQQCRNNAPTMPLLCLNYAKRDYATNFTFCPDYAPSFASTMPQLRFGRLLSCLIYYSMQQQLTTKIWRLLYTPRSYLKSYISLQNNLYKELAPRKYNKTQSTANLCSSAESRE